MGLVGVFLGVSVSIVALEKERGTQKMVSTKKESYGANKMILEVHLCGKGGGSQSLNRVYDRQIPTEY